MHEGGRNRTDTESKSNGGQEPTRSNPLACDLLMDAPSAEFSYLGSKSQMTKGMPYVARNLENDI